MNTGPISTRKTTVLVASLAAAIACSPSSMGREFGYHDFYRAQTGSLYEFSGIIRQTRDSGTGRKETTQFRTVADIAADSQFVALDKPGELNRAELEKVFLEAGIPVLDQEGVPIIGSPNGLAVTAWELTVMAELRAVDRGGMFLADLAEALTGIDSRLEGAPISGLMLKDIQEALRSPDASASRWAKIIDALSKARGDFTLATAIDPSAVVLDGLQIQIMLRRLASELIVQSRFTGPDALAKTSSIIDSAHFLRIAASKPNSNCSFSDIEDRIVSSAEKGLKFGFKQLLKYLQSVGVAGAKGALDATGIAQTLADLATFVLSYLFLEVNVNMEEAPPLVRTRERTVDGERKTLVATVRYELGSLTIINCFRLAFANMGFTFSMPQDGPVPGLTVTWKGINGFATSKDPIVQFRGRPDKTRTDTNGRAIVGIEGLRQKKKKPDSSTPIEKSATVWVLVQRDSSNLLDAINTAASLRTPHQALIRAILKLVSSSQILAPTAYTFRVIDWEAGFVLRLEGRSDVSYKHKKSDGGSGGVRRINVTVPLQFHEDGTVTGTGTGWSAFSGWSMDPVMKSWCKNTGSGEVSVDVAGQLVSDEVVRIRTSWTYHGDRVTGKCRIDKLVDMPVDMTMPGFSVPGADRDISPLFSGADFQPGETKTFEFRQHWTPSDSTAALSGMISGETFTKVKVTIDMADQLPE